MNVISLNIHYFIKMYPVLESTEQNGGMRCVRPILPLQMAGQNVGVDCAPFGDRGRWGESSGLFRCVGGSALQKNIFLRLFEIMCDCMIVCVILIICVCVWTDCRCVSVCDCMCDSDCMCMCDSVCRCVCLCAIWMCDSDCMIVCICEI